MRCRPARRRETVRKKQRRRACAPRKGSRLLFAELRPSRNPEIEELGRKPGSELWHENHRDQGDDLQAEKRQRAAPHLGHADLAVGRAVDEKEGIAKRRREKGSLQVDGEESTEPAHRQLGIVERSARTGL